MPGNDRVFTIIYTEITASGENIIDPDSSVTYQKGVVPPFNLDIVNVKVPLLQWSECISYITFSGK
jgi:hypothetical protein